MGVLDIAFTALKELPASGILRAQLDTLHTQVKQLEHQLEATAKENLKLQLQLEQVQADYRQCHDRHQELQARHAEEERIHSGVLFLKGLRTGGHWQPFCPKCRLPAVTHGPTGAIGTFCSDDNCGWSSPLEERQHAAVVRALK